MTEAIRNTDGKKRLRGRWILGAAAAIVLLGAGVAGFEWFTEWGSAHAHVISPVHEDQHIDRVVGNMFWRGMTRDELSTISVSIPMRIDGQASTKSLVVGVISDSRRHFRPSPAPAIRVELDFDENDKVIASRWSRITESR